MDQQERYARLREILNQLLALPPERWDSFVEAQRKENPDLAESLDPVVEELRRIETTIELDTDVAIQFGTQIGPYELVRPLGQGGQGEVWLAQQREPVQKTLALKFLPPEISSRHVIARFGDEKRALESMYHPNVAQLIDAGTAAGGRPYFAMEYVPGPPITTFCDEKRIDIAGRLELFLAACAGVQHAHQRGIIHRDLKPSNILVSDLGAVATPKVIDFGLAKAIGRHFSGDSLAVNARGRAGTREYMAPEQWLDRPEDIDTRADVYALGVVLYELLTGATALPMSGMSDVERFRTAREVVPPRPSERLAAQRSSKAARRVRGDLDAIAMKCLEKDRARRYETVADLAADIRRHQRHEPVLARKRTVSYVTERFIGRRRGALAVGTVLAASILTAAVFVGIDVKHRQEQSSLAALKHIDNARVLAFGHLRSARNELEEARRLAPDLPQLDFATTFVLARSGKHDAARARAEEAYRRHPDRAEAVAMLAGLVRSKEPARSKQLEEEGRTLPDPDKIFYYALASGMDDDKEAVKLLTKGLDNYPWNIDAIFQRGVRLYAMDDFDGAKADADLLLKIRKDMELVWNLRGSARLMSEPDVSGAIEDVTRAIAINPKRGMLYVNRAMAYRKSGDRPAALRDIDEALKLDPKDGEAWALKGPILLELKRYEEAVSALNSAIDLGSYDYRSFKDRGQALYRLDRCRDAEADFTRAIESVPTLPAPNRSILFDLRGVARRNCGDADGALADARMAVQLQPEFAPAHAHLGQALLFLGRRGEALLSFDRAVKADKGWRAYRGMAAWFNGDAASALSDLGAACGAPELAPDDEMVCLWRWEIYAATGDHAAAAHLLTELEGDPTQRTGVLAVAAALGGRLTETEVLERLPAETDRLYAWYVFGCRAAAKRQWTVATDWWKKCASFPQPTKTVRTLARIRLRLESAGTPGP